MQCLVLIKNLFQVIKPIFLRNATTVLKSGTSIHTYLLYAATEGGIESIIGSNTESSPELD